MRKSITSKIASRTLRIGVIGLGYVGLPLAVEKAKAGFSVLGFDIQQSRVDQVNRGENYIGDVVDRELDELVQEDRLSATTDFSRLADLDFVAICVPTPLDKHQQPDISFVRQTSETLAEYLHPGMIVVLESTTYPGTTEELVRPILERSGLTCGKDFYLGFSPERVDPGNLLYKTKNTPKVVGAIGDDAREIIAAVYRAVLDSDVFEVSSPAVAEMEKLLENTYRHVNIGLINEMTKLCDKMGISIWEVIEAAKTKPYGFQAFYPGAGLGGHCIPLDPYYLSWKAREYGFHTSMIEASAMINDSMPAYVVERAGRILNRRKKPLNGSRVLVMGVAYKPDIDDYRESPGIKVIDELEQQGCIVEYYDPYIPRYRHEGQVRSGIADYNSAALRDYDLAIITTGHTTVDYSVLAEADIPVLDCKNMCKDVGDKAHIELL